MIFQIMKNIVPKKYLKLYMVEADRFLFTDNPNEDEFGYGFILLKNLLDDIKPSTVIDV